MASVCTNCGAQLNEGSAFCTKCGARRSDTPEAHAAGRFCTKCGAPLGETKFCTKCGAPADIVAGVTPSTPVSAGVTPTAPPVHSQAAVSGAPVTKSSAGFPKTAITGIGIAVVLIITLAAGVAYVVHRVRQKAAQAQAQSEFERSLDANNQAAIEDLRKKLIHMARAAPDQKTWAAVEDLINKLSDLERATDPHLNNPWAQTPNKPMSQDEINKSLAEIAAAADSLARNSKQPPTPVDMNKSTTDAAAVANAIEQNANRQPGDIPPSALPPGTSAISVPPSGGFTWKSDGVTYTWNTQGLRLEYSRGANFYSGCPIGKPAPVETPPIAPVAATGNQAHDWALKYERTAGGPEADLVVRTGDINNLGFGWPAGFDPFSGQSTPAHPYPWKARPGAPAGTDRIMVGSSFRQGDPKWDGYSYSADCTCPADWAPCENRVETMPQAVTLSLGALPTKVNAVAFQIFADDFQPQVFHSHFQVSLNGTRIPTFEYAINSLNQTGPIGKLLTLRLLPEYWPLLESGTAKLLIDDPTTHIGDGYAIDFVRILVNPHKFKYQVSLTTTVTDADKHRPIAGATVSAALESAATDRQGKCQLKGIPAGLVVATADAPGYDENSVPVDLVAGQSGNAEIQLHRHQESTAALEQSIAQTGTATIYGIHFDTDSSRIRGDSIPALNAVLGLINGHPGSPWIIAGHTDNQGSVAHNQSLSEARARSVVSWLQQHGVEVKQLAPQGFGASRPVADNATANGRALNRRVEVALEK